MQIQDAILAELNASGLASVCKTIDNYHGQIDDLVADVQQLILPLPAAFVLYQQSTFSGQGNNPYFDEQTFSVLFIAKDLRGGDSLEASMYAMIEAGKTALIDKTLNLDIHPLQPVGIRAIKVTKLFSIYGFDVKTLFEMN